MKNRAVGLLVGVLVLGLGTSARAESAYADARQTLNTHYKNLNDFIQSGDTYAVEQQRQVIANDHAYLESLRGRAGHSHRDYRRDRHDNRRWNDHRQKSHGQRHHRHDRRWR